MTASGEGLTVVQVCSHLGAQLLGASIGATLC